MTTSSSPSDTLTAPQRFPRIGVVGRRRTPDVLVALRTLADHLSAAGHQIFLDAESVPASHAGPYPRLTRDELVTQVDLVAVLGGDGTMLGIARRLAGHNVPVIGINQGRLGFMTDIPRDHMLPEVDAILNGKFVSEERGLIEAAVLRDKQVIATASAFNDVVFSRGALGAMIEFEIFIDGQFVYSQRSDGLIVSTPTGSTAYALAAGGPILHPLVGAMALVPICPQSMSNRPIAVPNHCEVEFVLLRGVDCRVHFDGQSHTDLQEADRVRLKHASRTLTFLHPEGYNYYDVLREKLRWGEQLL